MMDRPKSFFDPRRLSTKQIVNIAEQFSRAYALLWDDFPANYFTINFELVYDMLVYPNYGIQLEDNDDLGEQEGEKVLGCYDPHSNTIALDCALNDQSRPFHWKKAFTFWHELGHAILHGEWLRSCHHNENTRIITVDSAFNVRTTARLERQANLFACHAAAPTWFVDYVLRSTFCLSRPVRYVGPSIYWLDVWRVRKICQAKTFHDLCIFIAKQIKHRFGGLSTESLSYRVAESEWIVDSTHREQQTSGCILFRTMQSVTAPVLAAV